MGVRLLFMKNFREKANLIWDIANLLRGDYKQSDYGKVILPLTVLRRLDCVLKPTKEKVLEYLPKIKDKSESAKDLILNKIAKHNFHNHSRFDFEKLLDEPDKIAANLRNFINGFSANAREIIEYFEFDQHVDRMDDPKADILFQVVSEFSNIDLTDMSSVVLILMQNLKFSVRNLIRSLMQYANRIC